MTATMTAGRSTGLEGSGEGQWLTAGLLAFGVVGWEQLLHTGSGGLPLYQALHWVSDSLMALPLALGAVWVSSRLAARRGIGRRRALDVSARAALMAMAFAVLLIPGGFLHEQLDTLTNAHQSISLHTHIGLAARDPRDPAVMFGFFVHAFSDGLIGQLVGFPLAILALTWLAVRSRATIRLRSVALNSHAKG